jgi:hypothetical protein
MAMTRRELLELTVLAMGAAACGSSSSGGTGNPPSCLDNGTSAAISDNHGHVLNVSKADVAAGVAKTYDIQGTAGHTHSVTVSAAMFAQLAANSAVSTSSTTVNLHDHSITVTCV